MENNELERAKSDLTNILLPKAIDAIHIALTETEGKDRAEVAFKILNRVGLNEKKDGPSELEEGARIATASITSAFKHLAKSFGHDVPEESLARSAQVGSDGPAQISPNDPAQSEAKPSVAIEDLTKTQEDEI